MNIPRLICLQKDSQWLPARRGALSASRHADADGFRKDGKPLAARNDYLAELVAERLTDWKANHPTTYWMERGSLLEPHAIAAYEAVTGVMMHPAGMVAHESLDMWFATPDGFHPDGEGLVEVKVPTPANYLKWVTDGVVPEQHIPQMVAQQVVTGRRYTHFIAYCPDYPPAQQLFVRRFESSEEQRDIANVRAEMFLDLLETMFHQAAEANYLEFE